MIDLIDVEKKYGRNIALTNCNLKIKEKGLVCITGESGCGKTTFVNMLGLLDLPSSGKIKIDNTDMGDEEERIKYRKEHISFIFQDALLFRQLNVKDNIICANRINDFETDDTYFNWTIKKLKIEELMERNINELSAGQKQRIAIARALIKKPKIILADEPTGNLDEENTKNIFSLFKELSKDVLVIVVTHNEQMAREFADRFIKIHYGKIVEDNQNCELVEDIEAKKEIGHSNMNKPNKNALFYAKANIKLNMKKYRKIIAVCVAAVLAIIIGVSFIQTSEKNTQNIESNFLQTNLITVEDDKNNNVIEAIVSEVSAKKIVSDTSFLYNNEVLEITENYRLAGFDIEGQKSTKLKDYSQVNIDDYYRERFETLDLIGDFIDDDSQIILSSSIAQVIFPNVNSLDCIGKKVTLKGIECEREFTVSGINEKEDVTGKIQTYISSSAVKEMIEEDNLSCDTLMLYTSKSYSEGYFDDEKIISIDVSGKAEVIDQNKISDESIICGRKIENEGEILLSDTFVETFSELFDVRLSAGEFDSDTCERICNTNIIGVLDNYKEFCVVGIYKSGDELSCSVSKNDKAFIKKVLPSSLSVYVDDQNIESICNLVEAHGMIAYQPYAYFKSAVGERMNAVTMLFLGLLAVIGVVVIMMIYTFSKNMISDYTEDIGMYKALGADNQFVGKIYLFEFGIISLIVAGVSIIIYPLLVKFINYLLANGIVNIMTNSLVYNMGTVIVVVLASIVMFIMACIPSVIKNTRIEAIQAIRKI